MEKICFALSHSVGLGGVCWTYDISTPTKPNKPGRQQIVRIKVSSDVGIEEIRYDLYTFATTHNFLLRNGHYYFEIQDMMCRG